MVMIYNKRNSTPPRSAVLVDRTTKFGNPYIIGKHGTRAEVLTMYRKWLWKRMVNNEEFRREVCALKGKDLICWCKPHACHADVLAKAAELSKT